MNVYLIWGRVPGACDDTSHVIAAGTQDEAGDQFISLLHEEYSESDLDAVFFEHGATAFICGCDLLGELVEVNGQQVIVPNPEVICGLGS